MIIPSIRFLYETKYKVDNDTYMYFEVVEKYLSSIDEEVRDVRDSKLGAGKPWNERISHYRFMTNFIKDYVKPCNVENPINLVYYMMKKKLKKTSSSC
jgi:hypothetical protein